MTDQSVRGNMAESSAIPDPRAQKLAMQGVANRVVRGLLRTPLLSRAVGSKLVTLYIVGRKRRRGAADRDAVRLGQEPAHWRAGGDPP